MTTDTSPSSVGPQGFYGAAVYTDDFDYSIVEDSEPLPSLTAAVRGAAGIAMNCVASIAVAGVVTLTPDVFMPSAYSEPVPFSRGAHVHDGTEGRPADLRLMTERMRERAGLVARLFQRTPHPGADEPDPDYGF